MPRESKRSLLGHPHTIPCVNYPSCLALYAKQKVWHIGVEVADTRGPDGLQNVPFLRSQSVSPPSVSSIGGSANGCKC